jgi:hypothetical protein
MKSRLTALTFSLFVLFFSTLGILLTTKAFADSFSLSGSVTTSTGEAVSGSTVEADSAGTTTSVATATTDSSGNYTLNIPSGTYDIHVTPPSGSNYSPIITPSKTILENSVINFVFAQLGLLH